MQNGWYMLRGQCLCSGYKQTPSFLLGSSWKITNWYILDDPLRHPCLQINMWGLLEQSLVSAVFQSPHLKYVCFDCLIKLAINTWFCYALGLIPLSIIALTPHNSLAQYNECKREAFCTVKQHWILLGSFVVGGAVILIRPKWLVNNNESREEIECYIPILLHH